MRFPGLEELEMVGESMLRGQAVKDLAAQSLSAWLMEESVEEVSLEQGNSDKTITAWAMVNTFAPKDIATRPFRFRGTTTDGKFFNYDFQKQIMDDPSQRVVVRKAAQMGISEIMVRECLARLCLYPATKALYALPTEDDVNHFSDTRIRIVLEQSPHLRGMGRSTDNIGRKRIGDSFLIVRGGWDYKHAQMIDADWLFIDEYDRHKPSVLPSFRERMSGSIYQYERDFSTPKFKDRGIDGLYKQGDQKNWFDICWSCGFEQVVGEEHIRSFEGDDGFVYSYHCLKCGVELEAEKRTGIWKAISKSQLGISSYWVTQFMSPTITARQMVVAKETTPIIEDYYNLKLGLPADDSTNNQERRFGEIGEHEAIFDSDTRGKAIMSIDWGAPWSWGEVSLPMQGGKRKVLWIECFRSDKPSEHPQRMAEVALAAGAGLIIADAGYGGPFNEEMRKIFDRKFWTIMTNSENRENPGFDNKTNHVVWGKVRCLESHYGHLRHRKIILPCKSQIVKFDTSEKNQRPAHEFWIQHHKDLQVTWEKGDDVESQLFGAAAMKKIVVASGHVHLATTSAYADVLHLLTQTHEEVDHWKRKTRYAVAVTGGRSGKGWRSKPR